MNTYNLQQHEKARARRQRILRLLEQGQKASSIARKIGVSRQRIYKLIEIAKAEA